MENNIMNNAKQIIVNEKVIGEVYLSSHGVWVAEPNFSIYSKSFLTEQAATDALIAKYMETL